MGPTDTLPGGCSVEALGPSKHRLSPWYHFHPSPAYFRMDCRRRPGGIHWEASRSRPTGTCRYSLLSCMMHLSLPAPVSCAASLMASIISTPTSMWPTEISRGCVAVINFVPPPYRRPVSRTFLLVLPVLHESQTLVFQGSSKIETRPRVPPMMSVTFLTGPRPRSCGSVPPPRRNLTYSHSGWLHMRWGQSHH